jgi:hypothetical protein
MNPSNPEMQLANSIECAFCRADSQGSEIPGIRLRGVFADARIVADRALFGFQGCQEGRLRCSSRFDMDLGANFGVCSESVLVPGI